MLPYSPRVYCSMHILERLENFTPFASDRLYSYLLEYTNLRYLYIPSSSHATDINLFESSLNLKLIFSSITGIFLFSSAQIEYSTKLQAQSIKPLHKSKWLLPFLLPLPLAVHAVVSFFP